MLTAQQLHIDGRRHTLLPATTLEAHRGEVLLVQADGQERRTALSLALTGRMKPSAGAVALGHDDSIAGLRRRSAIVDAPDVNAPEHHLTVRSLAAEDLALAPFKFRDRTRPTEWLVRHGFADIAGKWIEEVDPGRLLHLQLELALTNKDVELVVVDSPDRHTSDDGRWLPLLTRLAAGELGRGAGAGATAPPHPLMVVAVVARFPHGWDGPAAAVGENTPAGTVEPDHTAPVPVPAAAEAPEEPTAGEGAGAEPTAEEADDGAREASGVVPHETNDDAVTGGPGGEGTTTDAGEAK